MRAIVSFLSLICFLAAGCKTASAPQPAGPAFLAIKNRYAGIQATLHLPERPSKVAVVHAHPWGNSLGAFPAAELAQKGVAVLSFNTRAVNKGDGGQPDEILEMLLLDVAAAVQEMKDRGYQKIILMGGSAGGPLMSLYQNVAENGNAAFAGERKVFKFPGFFEKDGSPMRLPPADGLIFRNPICGTGSTFLNRLDPSIVDEVTGKRDPSLDMYNPSNGFDPKTGLASYSKEFIRRYGRAQAERMNRLIAWAEQRLAEIRAGKGPYTDDDLIIIRGARARLLFTDMSLGHGVSAHLILPDNKVAVPRHDRAPGHYALFGEVQDRNASIKGVSIHTLSSFLSMRAVRAKFINISATTLDEWGVDVESTNNSTVGNMMHVKAPWLLFAGTADDKINIAELIYNHAAARDKKIIVLRGATHGITSVDPKRFPDTATLRASMVDQIVSWIDERFGRRSASGSQQAAVSFQLLADSLPYRLRLLPIFRTHARSGAWR